MSDIGCVLDEMITELQKQSKQMTRIIDHTTAINGTLDNAEKTLDAIIDLQKRSSQTMDKMLSKLDDLDEVEEDFNSPIVRVRVKLHGEM